MSPKSPQVRTVDPGRRPRRRTALVALPLLLLGGVAYFIAAGREDASHATAQADAHALPASSTVAVASASAAASATRAQAAVAVPASASAPAARPWQSTTQPALVAAIRGDALAPYQVQVDRWSCEGEACVGNLRVPPTVEAGRKRDMSAASDIFNKVKEDMARDGIDVALQSIHPGPDGIAVDLQFSAAAARHGRFYTDVEITSIRAESFEQGMKAGQAQAAR